MLANQRDLFSLPNDLHYLNCASRSPLPRATVAAGAAAVQRQLVPVSHTPEHYFSESEAARTNFSSLVGCSAEQVAITPAVSYGIAIAAHSWPLAPGATVVVPDEEFPSDVYAWIAACQRSGASLRTVKRPQATHGIAAKWSSAIIEAIDASTAVVSLSTVLWSDGLCFDVTRVADRAREVGALVVIDATQSLGAAPFDYDRVAPDLLLCSAYKWLFGPEQLSFAVVGDRLLDAEPFEHHWSNRAGSQDTTGTGLRTDFRDGARRFDVGAHSNDVPLTMFNASADLVRGWGAAAIESYCNALMSPLEHYVAASSYSTAGADDHAAHIVGIGAASPAVLDRAMSEASRRNVRISRRGTSLRVSPNVYNLATDIEALIDALTAAESG